MADTKISNLAAHSPAVDTDEIVINDIAGPTTKKATIATVRLDSVTAGVAATVGGIQGDSPLTTILNEVSVCAGVGASVTLPTAVAGLKCRIINNGANALGIFPALADDLGAGVNTRRAADLPVAKNIYFEAYDATNWEELSVIP